MMTTLMMIMISVMHGWRVLTGDKLLMGMGIKMKPLSPHHQGELLVGYLRVETAFLSHASKWQTRRESIHQRFGTISK